jgi:hypothetical protein
MIRVIKSRHMRWMWNTGYTGEMKYVQDLGGKSRRKRSTGVHNRDGKIKMDFKGRACQDVKLIRLSVDRIQSRVPVKSQLFVFHKRG